MLDPRVQEPHLLRSNRCRVQRNAPRAGRAPSSASCGRAGASIHCPPDTKNPLDCASALFPSDGERHQKRGDHRNDRSTTQRSQPNRLKCNRHVKTSAQFIPHTLPFESPRKSTGNLPLATKSSRRFYDRDCRPGDPDHRFCLHVTCEGPHQKAGSAPGQRFSLF